MLTKFLIFFGERFLCSMYNFGLKLKITDVLTVHKIKLKKRKFWNNLSLIGIFFFFSSNSQFQNERFDVDNEIAQVCNGIRITNYGPLKLMCVHFCGWQSGNFEYLFGVKVRLIESCIFVII